MNTIDIRQKEQLAQSFTGLDEASQVFEGIEFDACTFKECNFSETTFSKCKFIECHFEKCNLSNSKLDYSKFSDVSFIECKLVGVDWTKLAWPGLTLPSPIKFYKCILNDSSFYGLSLEEIIIEECKVHDVDFREGDFSKANFSHTDLSNSLFIASNLSGADFTDALNYNIDINLNKIQGAKFSRYEAINLLYSLDIELVD